MIMQTEMRTVAADITNWLEIERSAVMDDVYDNDIQDGDTLKDITVTIDCSLLNSLQKRLAPHCAVIENWITGQELKTSSHPMKGPDEYSPSDRYWALLYDVESWFDQEKATPQVETEPSNEVIAKDSSTDRVNDLFRALAQHFEDIKKAEKELFLI